MMEYEFINPSDPYTFLAEDFETATLTVLVLGPQYGAKPRDGGESVPLFFLGGDDYLTSWYQEHFNRTVEQGIDAKRGAITYALLSFMLGDFEDRRRYEAALSAIANPDERNKFVEVWQGGCSSLNDIGTRAHKLGRKLKEAK